LHLRPLRSLAGNCSAASNILAHVALCSPSRAAPFEPPGECRKVHRIQHTVGRDAALSRHLDTPVRQADFRCGMRVRIDAHHAAQFERPAMPAPIEIEAPWVRVDFDRHGMLGAGDEYFLDVDVIARPPEQLATCHVSENGHERISDGPHYARGLLFLILPELAVDACHDEIEPTQHLVGIVERAVRQDVGLDPLEDAEFPGVLLVEPDFEWSATPKYS
jgi:hypothetical protein